MAKTGVRIITPDPEDPATKTARENREKHTEKQKEKFFKLLDWTAEILRIQGDVDAEKKPRD